MSTDSRMIPLSTVSAFDFDTFNQEEINLLHYDVFINIYIDGLEKSVVNRVQASSFKEALILGVEEELHNPSNILEVVNSALTERQLPFNKVFNDGDTALYKVTNVIRLRKLPITFPILMADNTFLVKHVLLPDAIENTYPNNYYFA